MKRANILVACCRWAERQDWQWK